MTDLERDLRALAHSLSSDSNRSDDDYEPFAAGRAQGYMLACIDLNKIIQAHLGDEPDDYPTAGGHLPMNEIGHRVDAWRKKNFGVQSRWRNAGQIGEEVGEVFRAIGKGEEGIRPETRGNLPDELGDVLLATLGMIAAEGFDPEEIINRRIGRMERLDFTKDPEGGDARNELEALEENIVNESIQKLLSWWGNSDIDHWGQEMLDRMHHRLTENTVRPPLPEEHLEGHRLFLELDYSEQTKAINATFPGDVNTGFGYDDDHGEQD